MISRAHRCIFIHIPRTGGSSVEHVIWPGERSTADLWMGFSSAYANPYQTGGLQHLTARLVRHVVGADMFARYFRFTVVRNPWDKAVSSYAYLRERPDLRAYLGLDGDASFKSYLLRAAERPHVQWQPQCSFLFDEDGRLLVDAVLRFEKLEPGIVPVFERLRLQADLPHINASRRLPLARYYGEEERALVEELYAEDIRTFGYTFPDCGFA